MDGTCLCSRYPARRIRNAREQCRRDLRRHGQGELPVPALSISPASIWRAGASVARGVVTAGRDTGGPHKRGFLDRALTVTEVLTDAETPIGISEVSRRANIPKSTTSRILGELLEAGLAARLDHQYEPGARLLSLAERIEPPDTLSLCSALQPTLAWVHAETGLKVAFGRMRYGRVRIEAVRFDIDKADSALNLSPWIPAHCSATGKVLRALGTNDIAPRPLTRFTESTITDPVQLSVELDRVRLDGIAYNNGEYIEGVRGVSVPVLVTGRRLAGALSACGPAGSFDDAHVGRVLREAARMGAPAIQAALRSGPRPKRPT
jgi:IclR family transcriptional regulator, KDG regulon repressor